MKTRKTETDPLLDKQQTLDGLVNQSNFVGNKRRRDIESTSLCRPYIGSEISMKPIDELIKCKHCIQDLDSFNFKCELAENKYQAYPDCCTTQDFLLCPYLGREDKDIRTGKRK